MENKEEFMEDPILISFEKIILTFGAPHWQGGRSCWFSSTGAWSPKGNAGPLLPCRIRNSLIMYPIRIQPLKMAGSTGLGCRSGSMASSISGSVSISSKSKDKLYWCQSDRIRIHNTGATRTVFKIVSGIKKHRLSAGYIRENILRNILTRCLLS